MSAKATTASSFRCGRHEAAVSAPGGDAGSGAGAIAGCGPESIETSSSLSISSSSSISLSTSFSPSPRRARCRRSGPRSGRPSSPRSKFWSASPSTSTFTSSSTHRRHPRRRPRSRCHRPRSGRRSRPNTGPRTTTAAVGVEAHDLLAGELRCRPRRRRTCLQRCRRPRYRYCRRRRSRRHRRRHRHRRACWCRCPGLVQGALLSGAARRRAPALLFSAFAGLGLLQVPVGGRRGRSSS